MVDFVKVDLPDPFGVRLDGGEVVKISADGEVEWSSRTKRKLHGSGSSTIHVRNISTERVRHGGCSEPLGFELDGNLTKYLQGHNLFGSDDVEALICETLRKVCADLFDGRISPCVDKIGSGELSRIDLTGSWVLDRQSDVLPFLRAMEERVWCPYRGRGVQSHPGTLYYGYSAKGKRAKDWQLKLYAKGLELARRPLPDAAMNVPGLIDEVNRTIRVELTLRRAELKRLGLLRVKNWRGVDAHEIWRRYVDRLNFQEGDAMRLDVDDLAKSLPPRLVTAVAAWKAGNDLRAGMSRATFYRYRKEIAQRLGIDIACSVPKSNIIPLRRVVEARPASLPRWRQQLTEAMRSAA